MSGLIGAHLGWRAMYLIATGVTLLLALALRIFLPRQEPALRLSYPGLLRSLPGLLREPLLRRHAILGALALAAFSAFWTTLTFLLEAPPFRLGSGAAGAFGIVGVAGALPAPRRDQRSPPTRTRRGAGRASLRWASGFRSSRWWRSSRSTPGRQKRRMRRRPPDGATLS